MSWLKLRHEALTRGKLADLEMLKQSLHQMGRKFVVFSAPRAEQAQAVARSDRSRVVDRA